MRKMKIGKYLISYALVSVLLLTVFSSVVVKADLPPDNYAPTANFSFSPDPADAGETVSFTDLSTDPEDGIIFWSWTFGDGASETIQWPSENGGTSHIYDAVGNYAVTLTVTDNGGETDTISKVVMVIGIPTADAGGPYEAYEDDTITFDGSGSSDPDGTIEYYTWSFGDGSTGTGVSPTHTYEEEGNYALYLEVVDNDGNTDTQATYVTILEGDPVAIIDPCGPVSCNKSDRIVFSGSDSHSNDPNEDIVSYKWYIDRDQSGFQPFGSGVTASYKFLLSGSATVRLEVFDDDGENDYADCLVMVDNGEDPTAAIICPAEAENNTPVTLDGSSSYDADGEIVSYVWQVYEGDGEAITKPNQAIVTHTFTRVGGASVILTVEDDDGNTNIDSRDIEITGEDEESTESSSSNSNSASSSLSNSASSNLAYSTINLISSLNKILIKDGFFKETFAVLKTQVFTQTIEKSSAIKSNVESSSVQNIATSSISSTTSENLNTNIQSTSSGSSIETNNDIESGEEATTPFFGSNGIITYIGDTAGEAIIFTGRCNIGNPNYKYEWNFGDGSTASSTWIDSNSHTTTHVYSKAGAYVVNLQINYDSSLLKKLTISRTVNIKEEEDISSSTTSSSNSDSNVVSTSDSSSSSAVSESSSVVDSSTTSSSVTSGTTTVVKDTSVSSSTSVSSTSVSDSSETSSVVESSTSSSSTVTSDTSSSSVVASTSKSSSSELKTSTTSVSNYC